MKLVEALRKRIERKKKNQSQIADRQRVSNWINGKAVPSLEHGIRILRLIEGKGEMKERNLETLQLPENAFIRTKEDREKNYRLKSSRGRVSSHCDSQYSQGSPGRDSARLDY